MNIHKYRIEPGAYTRITAEKIIHFGLDPKGVLSAWGEADPDAIAAKWEVCVIGTGWSVPEGMDHIGSCTDGLFVWHLYGSKLKPEPVYKHTTAGMCSAHGHWKSTEHTTCPKCMEAQV